MSLINIQEEEEFSIDRFKSVYIQHKDIDKDTDKDKDTEKKEIKSIIVPCSTYLINEIDITNILNKNSKEVNNYFYLIKEIKKIQANHPTERIATQMIIQYDYINIKNLSDCFKYCLDFYPYLLNSIKILLNNQIVHNNIDINTIIINSKTNKPLLTNFGYSLCINNKNNAMIESIFNKYCPEHFNNPIEIHLLSFLLTTKQTSLSLFNIETIIQEFIKHNNILHIFGSELISSMKEDAICYFNSFINKPSSEIIQDIILLYPTWDNYSLSILYLKILIPIYKKCCNNKNKHKNKLILLWLKMLVTNISLHPEKRFSLDATSIKWYELLESLEIQDYIDFKNILSR